MSKNKRDRKGKPGYFVGLTKQRITGMVKTLGIAEGRRLEELEDHYAGGDLYPDLIWAMLGNGGDVSGVVVVWDTESVTFAKVSGAEFIAFSRDHMDEIAELSESDSRYDNPMKLYKFKAAELGINVVVVNYIQIYFNDEVAI